MHMSCGVRIWHRRLLGGAHLQKGHVSMAHLTGVAIAQFIERPFGQLRRNNCRFGSPFCCTLGTGTAQANHEARCL
eukprot:Skav219119  [mRNA]  locus=scaffold1574:415813:416040:+ [translate_table: standard]